MKQKQFNMSLMKQQEKQLEKLRRHSKMDFLNESFDPASMRELMSGIQLNQIGLNSASNDYSDKTDSSTFAIKQRNKFMHADTIKSDFVGDFEITNEESQSQQSPGVSKKTKSSLANVMTRMQNAREAGQERRSQTPEQDAFDPKAFPSLPAELEKQLSSSQKSDRDQSDRRSISPLSPGSSNVGNPSKNVLDNRRPSQIIRTKNANITPATKLQPFRLDSLAEMPGKESEGSTSSLQTETELKSSIPEQMDEYLVETMNKHLGQVNHEEINKGQSDSKLPKDINVEIGETSYNQRERSKSVFQVGNLKGLSTLRKSNFKDRSVITEDFGVQIEQLDSPVVTGDYGSEEKDRVSSRKGSGSDQSGSQGKKTDAAAGQLKTAFQKRQMLKINQQESFTAQHDALAISQVFKDVFSYPIEKQENPLKKQKLKESQRFLEKDEVIYDESGRPITPKRQGSASSRGSRSSRTNRSNRSNRSPEGKKEPISVKSQDRIQELLQKQSSQKSPKKSESKGRVVFKNSSNLTEGSTGKTSAVTVSKFDEPDEESVGSGDAYVPPSTSLQDVTSDKRNDFERAMVHAVQADRENAKQEAKLISQKTKLRNMSSMRANEQQLGFRRNKTTFSPQVQKAVTMFRKRLDKEQEQKKDDDSKKESRLLQETSDTKPVDSELARLIQQTYQYIYSVEDKRLGRKINKIEDLFESNPMSFDDSDVNRQLIKLKKMKHDSILLKSHVQVYEESMAENKRMHKFMKFLIKKHKIDVEKDFGRTAGATHTYHANEDLHAYYTHKSNKFFKKETSQQRKPKEATALINYIIDKLTLKEEMKCLGQFMVRYLPPKMQHTFLTKCKHIFTVDYEDPAVYIQVDENQYISKQVPNPSSPKTTDFTTSPPGTLQSPIQSPVQSPKDSQVRSGDTFSFKPPNSGDSNNRDQPRLGQQPQSFVSLNTQLSLLDSNFNNAQGWNQPLPPELSKPLPLGSPGSPVSAGTRVVFDTPKMVQAYNMPYIFQKVDDEHDKKTITNMLTRYLQAQLRTMPRTIEEDGELMERFANLQKLLELVKDLHKSVTWGIKDVAVEQKGPLKNFYKQRQAKKLKLEQERMQKEKERYEKQMKKQEKERSKGIKNFMDGGKRNFRRLTLADIDPKHFQTSMDIGQGQASLEKSPEASSPTDRNFSQVKASHKVTFINAEDEMPSFAKSPGKHEDSVFSKRGGVNMGSKTEDQVNQIHQTSAGGSSFLVGGDESTSRSNLTNSQETALLKIVKKLAKQQIKRQVPQQVYRDCADIISKSLCVDKKALRQHKHREKEMKSRQLSLDKKSTQMSSSFYAGSTSLIRGLQIGSAAGRNQKSMTAMSQQMRKNLVKSPQQIQAVRSESVQQQRRRIGGQNHDINIQQKDYFPNLSSSNFYTSMRKSRVSSDVQHRSQIMIDKMKKLSETDDSYEFGQSTRPKFRKSVAELTQSGDYRQKSDKINLNSIKKTSEGLLNSNFMGGRNGQNQSKSQVSTWKARRASQNSRISNTTSLWEISEDKIKLKNLIRLCMNDDYAKANQEEIDRKMRRKNLVSFSQKGSVAGDTSPRMRESMTDMGKQADLVDIDQVGLAFRRSALEALNQDQILFKKIDMQNYVEELRQKASKEIYKFFKGIDPKTAPKNIKLLYLYFVGSRNLMHEMRNDSLQTYRTDQMKPQNPALRKAITGKCEKRGKDQKIGM